ncbi:MAG TPA: hypothetical protein VGR40_10260 [Candidatus Binatus sp.]|nr:hypothetical protein [Candidatus Binatus sp.]
MRHPVEMQARYNQMSLFHYMATCPGCSPADAATQRDSTLAKGENFAANWAGYFTPSFLFVTGDRGDHWSLLHPRGFGQLLPEQAALLALAMLALLDPRRRRSVVALLAWTLIAAVPAAMTVPSGAWQPEPGLQSPTPYVFIAGKMPATVPITPRLLFEHPESRRDALAMAPWTILSAAGFVVLIELPATAALTAVAVLAIAATTLWSGGRFVRAYFENYPAEAAPYFQYGMEQVVAAAHKAGAGGAPVFITNRMEMPYIYVLFFGPYPPEVFQREPVEYVQGERGSTLYAGVAHFDGYWFGDPMWAYRRLPQGMFVFSGEQDAPGEPVAEVKYPDGKVAYRVMVKGAGP